MNLTQTKLEWESKALGKYKEMISKIPIFHREIAKRVVDRKAQMNATGRRASLVEEPDIVKAFLSEVPMAFYSLMVRLLDEVGFDYKKYELDQQKQL